MSSYYRRPKPRWVIVRENEEARMAAQRDSRKNPWTVINERVRSSEEFKTALVEVQAAFDAFYDRFDSREAVQAELRAQGGRSKIIRQIVEETANTQVFQSQVFGSAPISAWIGEEARDMEARAMWRFLERVAA